MAVRNPPSEPVFDCPACAGSVSTVDNYLKCEECGYAPRHAAD
ncbi:hypothetical protein [Haloarchaeobius sp. DT45]